MNLRELEGLVPVEVWRDHSFSTPGFLSDPQPGMLTFLESPRVLRLLHRTPGISCVIATRELSRELDDIGGLAVTADPRRAFFDFHNHLARNTQYYWTDFPTVIDPLASIHPRACIAGKNVRIGPGAIVEANVVIAERCLIGSAVRIRAGVVLGSAGFQTCRLADGLLDMVHAGGILVHDRVEILSNAVVASAVFGQFTTIGEDCRIGNLAFLSHAVQIGPRTLVGHGSVINGNVRIGADVWIGPGVTLTHCLDVGDGAQVSLGSAVIRDVPAGRRVTSNIAIDHRQYLRHVAALK